MQYPYRPIDDSEMSLRRDEILGLLDSEPPAQSKALTPVVEWFPGELPHETATALLAQIEALQAELYMFLRQNAEKPLKALSDAGALSTAAAAELTAFLTDRYRIKLTHRFMSRVGKLGQLDKLEAAAEHAMDPKNISRPCCEYCKAIHRMFQRGLLEFRKPDALPSA